MNGAINGLKFAGVAQLVELQPSKLDVAGSRPVSRSTEGLSNDSPAHVAQLAEHVLGKDEVTRSIRVVGSTRRARAGKKTGEQGASEKVNKVEKR